MKKSKLKNTLALVILSAVFAGTALATGGNGNEPPKKESVSEFCKYFPLLCAVTDSGTGGNGNEPPKDS